MKTQKRKGFTIVELVIVIAVIAILAAVLIPTFSSVINSANESKDKQLITNLNKALAVDTAVEGKHPTMHSAILAAQAAGYDVEDINASAYYNEILWDSKNDLFCYLKKDSAADPGEIVYVNKAVDTVEIPATEKYRYFQICDELPQDGKEVFSIYAGKNWKEEQKETVLVKKVGFDVGFNTDIKKVTYDRSSAEGDGQDVVIRTNSYDTSLTINAPLDTVKHYDILGDLVIKKVAMSSYDEYGRVGGTCLITEGHIVVAEGGEMTSIAVNNKDTSKVEIETSGNGTVGVVFVATKEIAEEMDKPTKNDGVNDWFYNYTDAEGNPIELPENATDEQVTEYINTVIERINEIATSSVVYVKETNIYYDDIRDAVSAAANGQTIILVRDTFVEYKDNCYIRIDYGKELTFDLNGHMLTANTAVAGNTALIDNRGTLTIQDSTDKKCDGSSSGLLTNISTKADGSAVPGYASNTIKNNNTLYIKSGTVQNATTGGAAAYAVDCDDRDGSCSADVGMRLYITGGKLISNSHSIRMYLLSSRDNYAEISNAKIGKLWIQEVSSAEEKGTLKINNSILDSVEIGYNEVAENVNVEIKNSTINTMFNYILYADEPGNKLLLLNNTITGFYMLHPAKVITNGTFNIIPGSEVALGWILVKDADGQRISDWNDKGIRVEGESGWCQGYCSDLGQKLNLENCLADGYKLQDNGNGTYTVVKK